MQIKNLKFMDVYITFIFLLIFHLALLSIYGLAAPTQVEFDRYHYAILKSSENALIFLEAGKYPSLVFINANISFFPRKSPEQEVIDREILMLPEGKSIEGESSILFEWNKLNEQYQYNINSQVKVDTTLKKVNKKVPFPINKEELSKDVLPYLEATDSADITEEISRTAGEIVGNEDDLYKVIFKLANWTEQNIKYNLTTMTAEAVQKSSWVLKNKEGVCDELTNLFISFSRSLGIPARFISGQAYSNIINDFGNHGWAEVYFPGIGWIPVDTTFAQYGWVYSSHIKFKEGRDAKESAVDYSWQGSDIKIKVGNLSIISDLVNTFEEVNNDVEVEVEPIFNNVGKESYVPVQVTLKNKKDYYIPLIIYITKATGLEGSNKKTILLPPSSIITTFFIIKTPQNLEENMIYTSLIEVSTRYGKSNSTLRFSSLYNTKHKEEAKEFIESISTPEEKDIAGLYIECTTEKDYYYEDDNVNILCSLDAQKEFSELELCLEKECTTLNNFIGNKNLTFEKKLNNPGIFIITAEEKESKNKKFIYGKAKIIIEPNLKVTADNFKVSYYEEKELPLKISSSGLTKNISITIQGYGTIKINEISTDTIINIPIIGKDFYKGNINYDTVYQDEIGKTYSKSGAINIEVIDIPWYIKLIMPFNLFFSKLFLEQ